jgi:sulfite exporter TauE/SafE
MVIYAFGLGTMPMLFAITLLQRRISLFSGTHIKHWVPAAMLVLGGLFVIRGLNLGIPYLSPKSGITATGLKVQCCQKQ